MFILQCSNQMPTSHKSCGCLAISENCQAKHVLSTPPFLFLSIFFFLKITASLTQPAQNPLPVFTLKLPSSCLTLMVLQSPCKPLADTLSEISLDSSSCIGRKMNKHHILNTCILGFFCHSKRSIGLTWEPLKCLAN